MRARPVRRPRGTVDREAKRREHAQRVAGVGAEGLERVRRPRGSPLPRGGRQHAGRRFGPLGADVQPQEGTRAERERGHSRGRAALAVERRLLVSEHRRQRGVETDRPARSVDARIVGRPDLWQQRRRHSEQVEQPPVPAQGVQVDEQRPAGVRRLGDVCRSTAEMPGKPGRDVAEQQLATPPPAPEARIGGEEPGELRRGEGRVERETGRRRDRGRFGPPTDRRAQVVRALVLPAHHGGDRNPGVTLPEHERLRLVRDADRRDIASRPRYDLGDGLQRPGEQLAGIVLDHARQRALRRHAAGRRSHARASAGRRRRSACSSFPDRERGSRPRARRLFIRARRRSPSRHRRQAKCSGRRLGR